MVVVWKLLVCVKLFICYICRASLACGTATHIEISYRALYNYDDRYSNLSYDAIARQNQDALEAGSAFPDAFYANECFGGKYHNVSEDTHWTPFINASINYIQRTYPKPWNENTQKLVAFIMGVMSHQVADVSWHSLGIDQGFLQTMAKINFNGDFPSAHSAGDLGGDVLNLFQLNLNYSDVLGEWYVPVHDLMNIYKELYGTERIPEDVVVTCTQMLYLVKIVERLAVKKYFPISAKGSTFLVDDLYGYFLGGMEDMAMWTQRIWRHLTFAMENGQKNCNMDFNPLYIRCNDTSNLAPWNKKSATLKNGFYLRPNLFGYSLSDVIVEKSGQGVVLKPGSILKKRVSQAVGSHLDKEHKLKDTVKMKVDADSNVLPKAIFTTIEDYARLGSAFAVADLNHDGNEDVVIGAPGFYTTANQKSGMVFVLFGTDHGLNMSSMDISQTADVKIPGPDNPHGADSQFGFSLAILDIDKDGQLDIAVGAPSFGSFNLTYTGKIFIYSPVSERQYNLHSFVTCQDVYCNLGTRLATEDLNADLYNDLIVGSPFAPGQGEQRGTVKVVYADRKYAGKMDAIALSCSDFLMEGSQNYSWFGSSLAVTKFAGRNKTYLAIGEPSFRKCARLNCTFDSRDIQAMGQVHLLSTHGGSVNVQMILGVDKFQLFGTQVAFGRPFGQFTDVLAVAATGQDVDGHVMHIPSKFEQVGSVFLYNISNLSPNVITVFNGDRKFGRFGGQIKFSDLNRDGYDDLIIGAPLRTDDITEELYGAEQGKVYIYMGGPDFPMGDATANCGVLELVEPCPEKRAWRVLDFEEVNARFGSEFAVVYSKNKTTLLVTSDHSSKGARLSGAIGIFEF